MEARFESAEERGDGYTVVSVLGEIDVATAPDLHQRLEAALESGSPLLVVDLLGVTFIDSTGLSVLIEASKRCTSEERTMRVVVSEPRILRIFEITGLTELLGICATRREAIDG